MALGLLPQAVLDLVRVAVDVDPVELRRVVGDGGDVALAAAPGPGRVGVGEEVAGEEVALLGEGVGAVVGEVLVGWVDVGDPELAKEEGESVDVVVVVVVVDVDMHGESLGMRRRNIPCYPSRRRSRRGYLSISVTGHYK